jgi:hypothetical protein
MHQLIVLADHQSFPFLVLSMHGYDTITWPRLYEDGTNFSSVY